VTVADLYETFQDDLHRRAVQLSRDPDAADDLVQDTMVRAMANLLLLDQLEMAQQRAWLFTTCRNLFLDRIGAQKRRQVLQDGLQALGALAPGSDGPVHPNPFEYVPEQHRRIVEMRYVQGMTSTEIGRELDTPAATVRSRLHLAIRKLRELRWQWE